MKARALSLQKRLSSFLKNAQILNNRNTKDRKYATVPVACDAHMNEMPVPCEPWEPWYSDKQSFYSKFLIVGAAWFGFSVFMMFYTESFYMNCCPPCQPDPPIEMAPDPCVPVD